MPSPRFRTLTWNRPLLAQATELLAEGWKTDEPLDLSRLVVVVPTRQSGRRLREALALHAEAHRQAVFPPRVVLPESFLNELVSGSALAASRVESLLTWADILRTLDMEDFRHVFPVDPPARNFSWALRLAQDLDRLKSNLAEGGLRFADVSAKAGSDFEEIERWDQLAEIEARYTDALSARNAADLRDLQIAVAAAPPAIERCDRVVILATPDPLPLVIPIFESLGKNIPIEVVVFGPPAEEGPTLFDSWGRPKEDAWATRDLAWDDFEGHVKLCADPMMQAEAIGLVLKTYASVEGLVGVGVADPELVPVLEREVSRLDLTTFNPEGRPGSKDSLYFLLQALADLVREPSFEAFQRLARCPDFLERLQLSAGRGSEPFSRARFLAGVDELHARHLPSSLTEGKRQAAKEKFGKRYPEVTAGILLAEELHVALSSAEFPANASEALKLLFAGRNYDLSRPGEVVASEAMETWTEIVRGLVKARASGHAIATADGWELALVLFAASRRAMNKETGAIELLGWLELLWENAPHLFVAGMNDGRVPEAIVGDAFLPESLREKLGLRTNAGRFARDAYMLRAMAASRSEAGRFDVLVGKTSLAGDPLRPSRLLFACAEAELPGRVEYLFQKVESGRPSKAWSRAWKLEPRQDATFPAISVTAFRDYLSCPFRFYLKHGLKMESVVPGKNELDAMDFGNLVHASLEMLGKNEAIRSSVDEQELKEFLVAELDRQVRDRYGNELSLPLTIQVESARQRLRKAAEVQAQERAAGWLIDRTEWKFDVEIDGILVKGKIDRIDRNENSGAWRIIDYKTSDRAITPISAHLHKLRGESMGLQSYTTFDHEGDLHAWLDLQLPLYLHAIAAKGELKGEISCGYFNLPKAVGETGILGWESLSREIQDFAMCCVRGVIADIKRKRFWPPVSLRAAEDDFGELFQQGATDSVRWLEEKA